MHKEIKEKIRHRLFSEYRHLFSGKEVDAAVVKKELLRILEELIAYDKQSLHESDKEAIINEIITDIAGFGPIDKLMNDPQVTEIMINGPYKIYIEENGRKKLTGVSFENEQQLMAMIQKMLSPTRRRVDESFPYTEISLKDGTRINIVISPLALNGPVVTIRKFSKQIQTIEDLLKLGSLDKRMAVFLAACINGRINIIFSGATGTGKTTTLNVLSSYISDEERIVTIEDTAELKLNQQHVVRLEARQQNIEGKGEISIRDLYKNCLRMRPDRIIIGEIRGAEVLEMLQGICSGHTGALSVIHAESPQDVIYRIETMILTSGIPISLQAIHRQIAAAINIIVQHSQLQDGSRKIIHISQVNGIKDGQVEVEDIFVYDLEGVNPETKSVSGRWKATGVVPCFFNTFKKLGIPLSEEIFRKD